MTDWGFWYFKGREFHQRFATFVVGQALEHSIVLALYCSKLMITSSLPCN